MQTKILESAFVIKLEDARIIYHLSNDRLKIKNMIVKKLLSVIIVIIVISEYGVSYHGDESSGEESMMPSGDGSGHDESLTKEFTSPQSSRFELSSPKTEDPPIKLHSEVSRQFSAESVMPKLTTQKLAIPDSTHFDLATRNSTVQESSSFNSTQPRSFTQKPTSSESASQIRYIPSRNISEIAPVKSFSDTSDYTTEGTKTAQRRISSNQRLSLTVTSKEVTGRQSPSFRNVPAGPTTENPESCLMDCHCISDFLSVDDENFDEVIEKKINELKQVLSVNKTNLSSSRRLKESAPDDRKSSKSIGFVAAFALALLPVSVLVSDAIRVCTFIKKMLCK